MNEWNRTDNPETEGGKEGHGNMKEYIYRIATIAASLALMVTAFNVNSACMMFVHQPKLPDKAQRLRNF